MFGFMRVRRLPLALGMAVGMPSGAAAELTACARLTVDAPLRGRNGRAACPGGHVGCGGRPSCGSGERAKAAAGGAGAAAGDDAESGALASAVCAAGCRALAG